MGGSAVRKEKGRFLLALHLAEETYSGSSKVGYVTIQRCDKPERIR